MTAFQRFPINIWRLRITYPQKDILLHTDDIDAALRHILYAPDMAIIFAYVFGPYMIVPVGMVFGAQSARLFSAWPLIFGPASLLRVIYISTSPYTP
jgi:hypothetical protein